MGQECNSCNATYKWENQEKWGCFPAINIKISSAILLSGAGIKKVFKIFNMLNVAMHSYRSYFTHQKKILHPCVKASWEAEQAKVLAEIKAKGTELCLLNVQGIIRAITH